MRSLGWALILYAYVLTKEEKSGLRHTHTHTHTHTQEEHHVKVKAEIE